MGKIVYGAKFDNGILQRYTSWPECQKAVSGVSGVLFQGFDSYGELIIWENKARLIQSGVDIPLPIKIFTDGSFKSEKTAGRNIAGWGMAVTENDEIVYEDYGTTPFEPTSRNIDGECFAVIKAIEWAVTNKKKVAIIYDYISIGPWCLGIQNANTETSKWFVNKVNSLNTDNIIDSIIFSRVDGHSGIKWNEHVDGLAAKAISEAMKE